jgi:hypothetical protein
MGVSVVTALAVLGGILVRLRLGARVVATTGTEVGPGAGVAQAVSKPRAIAEIINREIVFIAALLWQSADARQPAQSQSINAGGRERCKYIITYWGVEQISRVTRHWSNSIDWVKQRADRATSIGSWLIWRGETIVPAAKRSGITSPVQLEILQH